MIRELLQFWFPRLRRCPWCAERHTRMDLHLWWDHGDQR